MNIVRTCFFGMIVMLQCMSLFAMRPAVDLVGVYERRCSGDLLYVVRHENDFYLADSDKMQKIYLVYADDERYNFIGWGMGVAFVIEKDSDASVIDLIAFGEDSVASKVYVGDATQEVPPCFCDHAIFFQPKQPYRDLLPFCAGVYVDESGKQMHIVQNGERLFWAGETHSLTLKQGMVELFPQVSTESVPGVVCFYANGFTVFFEVDPETKNVKSMSVFTRDTACVLEKMADGSDVDFAEDIA